MLETKKVKERYKDRKFHEKIHIQLKNEQTQQYNTNKNNVALLNGSEIVVMVSFSFVMCVSYIIHRWIITGTTYFYQDFLLKEAALTFVQNIVVPIGYLMKKKDVRKYVCDYIHYLIRSKSSIS